MRHTLSGRGLTSAPDTAMCENCSLPVCVVDSVFLPTVRATRGVRPCVRPGVRPGVRPCVRPCVRSGVRPCDPPLSLIHVHDSVCQSCASLICRRDRQCGYSGKIYYRRRSFQLSALGVSVLWFSTSVVAV